jgi:uncharacterized small protein (DUF1192 family)
MSQKEHPVWEEELMPYFDGQLDAAQASVIEEHLKECQECAAIVADARSQSMQMGAWDVENSPEKMGEPVLAELRLQEKKGRRQEQWAWWSRNRMWAYGLGGAVAAAVLVAVVLIPRQGEDLSALFELERDQNLSALSTASLPHEVQQGQPGQEREEAQKLQPAKKETQVAPELPSGPMVIRNAQLTILTKEFESARSRIQAIVQQTQGYLDQLTVRGETGSGKSLSATLRLPSTQIESGLAELRKLGKVLVETQNSSDVTSQYVDLQARLTNARNTEQRLLALQRERTDKLTDVVGVEREIARVREEIERMEAQRKDVFNKTQFATIQVELSEEYRAELQPSAPSAGTQLHNALFDGYHGALNSLLALALFVLRYGPALLLWAIVLVPVVLLLRRRLQGLRIS